MLMGDGSRLQTKGGELRRYEDDSWRRPMASYGGGPQVARLLVREYGDDLNGVFVQRCSLAVRYGVARH